MPKLALERRVRHQAGDMFALVDDLDSYPRFVPNCRAMAVAPGEGGARLATMTIGFGPFTPRYTSRVVADRAALTIAAQAVEGPFAFLDSVWRFEPADEGSLVRFALDFKIANPLLAAAAEPAFARKQDEIIDAFVLEADRRYWRPS